MEYWWAKDSDRENMTAVATFTNVHRPGCGQAHATIHKDSRSLERN